MFNVGALVHVRLRKNSMVQQELHRISDPSVPSTQRRYNPAIIQGMAGAILVICSLATLTVLTWEKYGMDPIIPKS